MDLAEIEAAATAAPNPLAVTAADVELSHIGDLQNDVVVRHRRLSQLETYLARIEDQAKNQPTPNAETASVIDEELSKILGQLEEEIEWGDDAEAVSSAITAFVPNAQREAFKAMLESTFAAYDKDGDGSLSKEEFEKYARDTFPENMASHVSEMFALLDLNGDGKIQKEEFVKAYLIDEL